MKARVHLYGNDDVTTFYIDLNNEVELNLLEKLQRLSCEASTNPAKPFLKYEIVEEDDV